MEKRPIKIAPSLLAADFSKLGEEVASLERAGADWIHLDVMDGHFVPNLTMGPDIIRAIRSHSNLPFDTHLMVDPALHHIEPFALSGSNHITIHVEIDQARESIKKIKSLGKKAGLAIKPATPVDALFPYLDDLGLILVMTVEPGFGGQAFMEGPLDKIRILHKMIQARGLDIDIAVDGGINKDTAPLALAAGANVLVAGTAIFKSGNYGEMIEALKGTC
jgi:ribulose-phosphate 3-epimerase